MKPLLILAFLLSVSLPTMAATRSYNPGPQPGLKVRRYSPQAEFNQRFDYVRDPRLSRRAPQKRCSALLRIRCRDLERKPLHYNKYIEDVPPKPAPLIQRYPLSPR